MKLNKISLSFAALAAMMMVSCSEGKYWEAPADPGQVYAFPKAAETLSIPADGTIPSSFNVTINRNEAGAEATVPVKFESTSPVLSGPSSVTFPAGSATATYTINIADGAKAGITYTANLTLEQPKDALTHVNANNLKFTFNLSQVLVHKWADAGTAATLSNWAGNKTPIEIPVQEATNWPTDGQRLMRLVSPYWYLEGPEIASEGANLQFLLNKDGDALAMYSSWQYMGESDADYGYFFFGTPAAYGGYFMNQGNIFVMNGVVAYGASLTGGSLSLGWYETIQFLWSNYGK